MAFPQDLLDITVELALGADLAADPATWVWTDITDFVKPRVKIEGVGQADEQTKASSAKATFTVDNTDGRFVRRNPLSPYYGQLQKGTPIRVTASDGVIVPSTRFQGAIAELPPRWEAGYGDQWVPITANGVLRRLDQVDRSDSVLRRYVLGTPKLRAYWPLEDGSNATFGAAATPGQNPTWANSATEDVSWSSASDLPGSASLPSFGAGAQIGARINGGTAGPWIVAFAAKGTLTSDATDGDWLSARIEPTGTDLRYIITGTDTKVTVTVQHVDTGSTIAALDSADLLGTLSLAGTWHTIALAVSGGTGTVTLSIFVDGRLGDTGTTTGTGRNVGRVDRVYFPHSFDADDVASMQVGHLAVWSNVSLTAGSDDVRRVVDYHRAAFGFDGETAGDRIRRLCAEENIPCDVNEGVTVGKIPASTRMGPQGPGSVGALLGQAAAADEGLLYEDPRVGGVAYLARSALYERATGEITMDLDIDAGDLSPDFEPEDGDQFTADDVTISRSGGSSARVTDVPAREVPHPRSATLNLAADGATWHHASWGVHMGTVDEYRYPVIALNLLGRPELIAAWMECRVGSRVTIANPPPGHPPGDLDLIIVGYTEVLDGVNWLVWLNCAPSAPYRVARFPGELTVVGEDFEDAALAFTVTNGGNAAWFRTQDDAFHGAWSWRSGAIGNSQTSDAIVTVPAGCTRVRFWYRTSCEGGFDFFRVIVGGSTRFEASGVSGWTLSDYITVTPGGTVTFRYVKDSSNSLFGDRVYVDDIQFEGGSGTDGGARLDTSGSVLAAAAGPDDTELTVTTVQGPVWISSGLVLSGTAGAYASTDPDTSIVGDLRVSADIAPDRWASGDFQYVVSQYDTTGANRAYSLRIGATGNLEGVISPDGSAVSAAESTVPIPAADRERLAVSVHVDVDNGDGGHDFTFWYASSIDVPEEDWLQLGDTVTVAGTTSIYTAATDLVISGRNDGSISPFAGRVFAVEVADSTRVIADPDFTALAPGDTTLTDPAGNVWTFYGGAGADPVAEFPFDLALGGEIVTVTAITGVVSPQTFTVVRSVNGVHKPHEAGADVRLAYPMILALGN